ncbi:MAG TPA: hypothetical protein VK859_06045, partial [bacterium]|nr:hypothetical protein [bacterium]
MNFHREGAKAAKKGNEGKIKFLFSSRSSRLRGKCRSSFLQWNPVALGDQGLGVGEGHGQGEIGG